MSIEESAGPTSPDNSDPTTELTGPALARAAIDAARNATTRRSAHPMGRRRSEGTKAGGFTAAGPDPRDPQPLARLIKTLLSDRGWRAPAAEGAVFGAWDQIVGGEIAAHCRPTALRDGELTVQAESTAWATQLRLFTKTFLAKLAQSVGDQVVTKIRIHGPSAPSWRKGRLSVKGPGPRDTYG